MNHLNKNVNITFFIRKLNDNQFTETKDIELIKRTKYGPYYRKWGSRYREGIAKKSTE